MTEQGKDKLLLLVGSLGWVFAGVFIILFFVMLRPSVYREGYDYGSREQKSIDQTTADSYFQRPVREGKVIRGTVTEINDSSVVVEVLNIQTNPLRGSEPIMHELLLDAQPIILVQPPSTQEAQQGNTAANTEITVSDLEVGDNLFYVPTDYSKVYDKQIDLEYIEVYRNTTTSQTDIDELFEPIEFQRPQ